MKEYTILLADDNASWLETLARQIIMFENYKIVAKTVDGRDTLLKLQELRPDIVILDIIMPHYDGTYIVDYIRTKIPDYSPVIFIVSGLGTDSIIQTLAQLNIDYYLIKPVSAKMILDKLNMVLLTKSAGLDTAQPMSVNTEKLVESFLCELKLPTRTKSYRYLRQALIEAYQDEKLLHLITKNLYPIVSKLLDEGNSLSVERGIRHAISNIVSQNTPLYQQVFGACAKMTNGEFLTQAVKYLHSDVENCVF